MWLQYLQNQLNKYSKRKWWLFALLSLSLNIYAQTIGSLGTVQKLIELDQKEFLDVLGAAKKNPRFLEDFTNTSLYLHPAFTKSLMLNSSPSYLSLLNGDKCRFYSLLRNNLLRTQEGNIINVLIQYKNKDGKLELTSLPVKRYLQFTYEKECKSEKIRSELFELKNFSKTLKSEKFILPTDQVSCKSNFNFWANSFKTPYYCGIIEKFKLAKAYQDTAGKEKMSRKLRSMQGRYLEARKYRNKVTYEQMNYLKNICSSIHSQEKYCSRYLNQSYWRKISQRAGSREEIEFLCKDILNKKKLNKADFDECAFELENRPEFCHFAHSAKYPSLTPRPSCQDISKALSLSKLKSQYKDCPGNIDNEGVINIARIVNHMDNLQVPRFPSACNTNPTAIFLDLVQEYGSEKSWTLSVCYDDKINDTEVCLPTIMGDHPASPYSEGRVLETILQKTRGTDESMRCQVIDQELFKPQLLKYKTGCWGIYNKTFCTASSCPKKVVLNEVEMDHIRYKGNIEYDYFPSKIKNERYSISNILKEFKRYKTYRINNYTRLKHFFKTYPRTIIHGIGCAEDLLPTFFQKKGLNDCRPLSFIVDGHESEKKNLILRTAIDDLHAPRIIPWVQVYNAVSNYQVIHPLRHWTMYALY